mmetsp:Transcript_24162/g.35312  ORF Transcript_24162/g.35312 Transcript_24162/m.35312 type:complete len:136 (-) Transcript_24162:226-633(-)|eukprot:CAMPEP_0195533698 /NCGR_PEP_ID=MMETSP0794_2-20130614/41017_1 /TAXON_ID=515487 /ORGANISM="Stephanopyxis turris, Strain CCMP 815" /LENGTH=135 /DNA_ID=CAMNT_0040666327 /DNA_START=327 /DNA_END=734 /DNA_ORIENTATION=+
MTPARMAAPPIHPHQLPAAAMGDPYWKWSATKDKGITNGAAMAVTTGDVIYIANAQEISKAYSTKALKFKIPQWDCGGNWNISNPSQCKMGSMGHPATRLQMPIIPNVMRVSINPSRRLSATGSFISENTRQETW